MKLKNTFEFGSDNLETRERELTTNLEQVLLIAQDNSNPALEVMANTSFSLKMDFLL